MPQLPIILLAAGASKRMRGRDKLLEDVDGAPLLRERAAMAIDAGLGPVFITLPPDKSARAEALHGLDVAHVPVCHAQEGMSASLRAALAVLPTGTDHVMVLLADMPDLTAADLRAVAAALDPAQDTLVWRASTETGLPGHPIVFAAALFAQLMQTRGDFGGRDVVKAASGHVRLVPLPGMRARTDLDTPEDWSAWRGRREADRTRRA
ncbi:MAG: nucleotidyltransferase family protein [Pseudomonadota bacterium]